MSLKPFEFDAFLDSAKKAFAPMVRFNEIAAKNLERTARYQYGLAGEYLDLGIAQLQAASQAKDFSEMVQKQTELSSAFVEKQTARSQDLMKLAGETQSDFTKWLDQTAAEFASARKL
jgi:phasin family protein